MSNVRHAWFYETAVRATPKKLKLISEGAMIARDTAVPMLESGGLSVSCRSFGRKLVSGAVKMFLHLI
jgi:hypothetical protein